MTATSTSREKARSWIWTVLIASVLALVIHWLQFGSVPADESDLVPIASIIDSSGEVDMSIGRVRSPHLIYYLAGYDYRFVVAMPHAPMNDVLSVGDSVTLFVYAKEWERRDPGEDILVYGIHRDGEMILSAYEVLDKLNFRFPFHPLMIAVWVGCIWGLYHTRKSKLPA
jgi:hypothetical protein